MILGASLDEVHQTLLFQRRYLIFQLIAHSSHWYTLLTQKELCAADRRGQKKE
jgi:hypothetical protein